MGIWGCCRNHGATKPEEVGLAPGVTGTGALPKQRGCSVPGARCQGCSGERGPGGIPETSPRVGPSAQTNGQLSASLHRLARRRRWEEESGEHPSTGETWVVQCSRLLLAQKWGAKREHPSLTTGDRKGDSP